RPGANRGECFHPLAAVRNPIKELRVLDFFAGSPSARHDQNVKIRATLEGEVWYYAQAPGRDHDIGFLRDQADFKRRRLFAPPSFVEPGDGKNLERTAKVQDFNVWKNQYASSLAIHKTPFSTASSVIS